MDPAGSARSRAGVAGRPSPDSRMLTLPFKRNQDRRHHISRQEHKVTNWREYDASLRQRGSLTVWFSAEAIEGWRAALVLASGDPDGADLAVCIPPRPAPNGGADRLYPPSSRSRS